MRQPEAWLVRHGETEWSATGRHTGRTDLELNDAGRAAARGLAAALADVRFARVLTSPLRRAHETAELAGLADGAEVCADLCEWDYGDYEGRTTPQIRADRPDWDLWRDGCPGGETPVDVGARADRVIASIRSGAGPVAVFAHGHLLRVLAARWIEQPPAEGSRLALDTASISVLGWEHQRSVVRRWNSRG